ncbi:type II toxin-antitoxin system RelE/ParE family toxin [Tautonia marina]|uniref:type II toxin-antitoxin system RelE/ParE family toxin n=1 Tax=Tautonia marina TaxID=2653855 RepID=UPI0012612C3A|nr:type II toxin-antitoxin system RelE/ParE family toxin [Tautonia marina]
MRLTYHPEVEADLIEAARFYEEQSPGTGARFLDAFDAAIVNIRTFPTLWPEVETGLRCHTLKRFPFAIYYRIRDEELRVLVVKHHRRHPEHGRDRFEE